MRFWITVAVFAVLNLSAWIAWIQWAGPRGQVLELEEPTGEVISDLRTLRWSFNLPMRPELAEDPGMLTPAVAGRWAWSDPRTLTFTAASDLPLGTVYTATLLRRRLSAVAGFSLAEDATRSFHTPALSLGEIRAGERLADGKWLLTLGFSDRVLGDELRKHLTVTDSQGTELPVSIHGEPEVLPGPAAANGGKPGTLGQTVLVRVAVGPVIFPEITPRSNQVNDANTLIVTLTAGLGGTAGPLGLATNQSRMVTLGQILRVVSLSSNCPRRGPASLTLHCTGKVDSAVMRRAVKLEPAVAFTTAMTWQGIRLDGDFQPGTRYAVTILPRPTDVTVDAWPVPDTLGIELGNREPGCWFDVDGGYLGAGGNRTVLVHAVNLSEITIALERLVPEQLVAWRATGNLNTFAVPVATRSFPVASGLDRIQDLRLDLDKLAPAGTTLGDGVYQLTVRADPKHITAAVENSWLRPDQTVVSLSDLALSARVGNHSVVVWATSLREATPQAQVAVKLFSRRGQPLGTAMTNARGLGEISLTGLDPKEVPGFVIADRPGLVGPAAGDPRELAPGLTWLDLLENSAVRDDSVATGGRPYLRQGHEAFVFTDRGVYRPGDTVQVRALIRAAGGALPGSFPVRLRILRPDRQVWRSETAVLDADGDTALTIPLPNDLRTGHWTLECGLPGDGPAFGEASFQVEDFLPDRLQTALTFSAPGVALSDPTDGPPRCLLAAGPLTGTLQGDWLFGQPAAGQPGELDMRLDPATFSPSAWKDWAFGDALGAGAVLGESVVTGHRLPTQRATLDAHGRTVFTVDVRTVLGANPVVGPWRLSANAGVQEASGRTTSTAKNLIIDGADRYLGLRLGNGAVIAGGTATLDLRLVTPDGRAASAADTVEITLHRDHWETVLVEHQRSRHYESRRHLEPLGPAQTVTLADGSGTLALAIPGDGSFVITAKNLATHQTSVLGLWAGTGDGNDGGFNRERPERCLVSVVADPRTDPSQPLVAPGPDSPAPTTWQAGDRCAVVIRSPFPGRVLMTIASDRVLDTQVQELTGTTAIVPLTIPTGWSPNVWISATVIRSVDPTLTWRIHRAYGLTVLTVRDPARRATVGVQAADTVRPGASLPVTITVRDDQGAPLGNAAVSLAAVDEGILRLTNFTTPDPWAFFTARRALEVDAHDGFSALMPEVSRPAGEAPTGGDAGDALVGHRPPIAARRVRPLALWQGNLRTNPDGTVQTTLTLPEDFAGQVRLMAVADRGAACGSGAATTIVRGPLVIQSSWPRAIAPGDRFTVPVAVFAQGVTAPVTVELTGIGDTSPLDGPTGEKTVTLGPDGRGRVELAILAQPRTGVARLRLVARSGGDSAVETLEIPVRPGQPAANFGGEATVIPGTPLVLPLTPGLLAGADREVRIQISPTPTLALGRGLDALYRYPHGCAEQTVSGLLPLIVLPDLAMRLGADRFPKGGLAQRLGLGIQHLQGMEVPRGGLAMWSGGQDAWPWASLYAAHALVEARLAGHPVPEDFLRRLLQFARHRGERTGEADLDTSAYAGYVLARAGQPQAAILNRLMERIPRQHPASAWLAAAWAAAGRRDLAISLLPERLPQPRIVRHRDGDLVSPVRDRAVLVLALVESAPNHPALPRLVAELAKADTWASTQDTAFAILALGRWLRIAPPTVPYAQVELWDQGRMVAQADQGHPLEWHGDSVGPLEVRITGGPGATANVDWTQHGVPTTPVPAVDQGLTVRREWLDGDGKPVGAVAVGDLVQVRLTVSAPDILPQVIVEDLLPAGFDIENPRLASSAKDQNNKAESDPVRVDVRDDRLILAGDVAQAEQRHWVLTHTYLIRAVSAGTFQMPPVQAECMYDKTLRSLHGGGTVVIHERTR